MEILRIDKSQTNLVFNLFDKYRQFYNQKSDLELAKYFIQERLNNNESVIFVSLSNFTPIGFTQLFPLLSSVHAIRNWLLNDLYVEEEYRMKGIGEALIRHSLNFAKEDNAIYVELHTAIDNYTAQRLYEQIGFEKQQTESKYLIYRINLR